MEQRAGSAPSRRGGEAVRRRRRAGQARSHCEGGTRRRSGSRADPQHRLQCGPAWAEPERARPDPHRGPRVERPSRLTRRRPAPGGRWRRARARPRRCRQRPGRRRPGRDLRRPGGATRCTGARAMTASRAARATTSRSGTMATTVSAAEPAPTDCSTRTVRRPSEPAGATGPAGTGQRPRQSRRPRGVPLLAARRRQRRCRRSGARELRHGAPPRADPAATRLRSLRPQAWPPRAAPPLVASRHARPRPA